MLYYCWCGIFYLSYNELILCKGFLKDINGMYDYAFYFGGSGVLLGSLVLTVTNVVHYIQTRQSYQM
jgi:hypothetical protein